MDSGYYAACAGLAAQTQALELVAHNLANLATTGYRGQQTTFRSLLAGRERAANALNAAVNNYGVLSGSRLDLTPGSLRRRESLGRWGFRSGFLAVQSAQGTLYTRDGSFHLTPTGQLVTSQGNAVLGAARASDLAGRECRHQFGWNHLGRRQRGGQTATGGICSRNQSAGGGQCHLLRAGRFCAGRGGTSVHQGMLEGSNVSPTEGVVELISVQRNTEMLSRALSALDGQLNQIAVQDLPKV